MQQQLSRSAKAHAAMVRKLAIRAAAAAASGDEAEQTFVADAIAVVLRAADRRGELPAVVSTLAQSCQGAAE